MGHGSLLLLAAVAGAGGAEPVAGAGDVGGGAWVVRCEMEAQPAEAFDRFHVGLFFLGHFED
jgi:hypothetical protein